MSSAQVATEQRLVLGDVPWQMYQRLLRAFDERHVRITYDRGSLEIMTLSPEHERYKQRRAARVEVFPFSVLG